MFEIRQDAGRSGADRRLRAENRVDDPEQRVELLPVQVHVPRDTTEPRPLSVAHDQFDADMGHLRDVDDPGVPWDVRVAVVDPHRAREPVEDPHRGPQKKRRPTQGG